MEISQRFGAKTGHNFHLFIGVAQANQDIFSCLLQDLVVDAVKSEGIVNWPLKQKILLECVMFIMRPPPPPWEMLKIGKKKERNKENLKRKTKMKNVM